MTATADVVVHQIFPPLSAVEIADLRRSIQSHGVLHAITVDQHGQIIDGHHRKALADELDVSCPVSRVEVRDESHACELALELNLARGARRAAMQDKTQRNATILACRERGMSTTRIAELIGVPQRTVADACEVSGTANFTAPVTVEGKDGKQHPATQVDKSAEAVRERRKVAADMAQAGATRQEIADALGVSVRSVYTWLGDSSEPEPGAASKTADAVAARYRKVRALAADGYTSAQIAAAVGLTEAGVKSGCRERGIDVPADAVMGKARRHDSNRIVAETVDALEGAAHGIRLVRLADLDRSQIEGWTTSLNDSLRALTRLNKQMKEMAQ